MNGIQSLQRIMVVAFCTSRLGVLLRFPVRYSAVDSDLLSFRSAFTQDKLFLEVWDCGLGHPLALVGIVRFWVATHSRDLAWAVFCMIS
jgi:hypothetical protein